MAVETYQYNLPTHYLVFPVIMEPGETYSEEILCDMLGTYPVLGGEIDATHAAITGAEKLGLVEREMSNVALTQVGEWAKHQLQADLDDWSHLHEEATRKGNPPLADLYPAAGIVLRRALVQDVAITLLMRVLKDSPTGRLSEWEVARRCAESHPEIAERLFLTPRYRLSVQMADGLVDWVQVPDAYFRTRTSYQLKSILIHAGLLEDNGLGANTASKNRPRSNIWIARG